MLFITHKVGLLQWQQMGAAKSCTWLRASCYIHSSRGRSYLIGEEAAFSGGLEQDVLQLGYRSRCPQEQQKTSLGTGTAESTVTAFLMAADQAAICLLWYMEGPCSEWTPLSLRRHPPSLLLTPLLCTAAKVTTLCQSHQDCWPHLDVSEPC